MPRRVPDLSKADCDDRLQAQAYARRHPHPGDRLFPPEVGLYSFHARLSHVGICCFHAAGARGVCARRLGRRSVVASNGRVTIVAKDATVRQILTEWARVGKTKIVNVERIPGGPLTLELKDVPERRSARRAAPHAERLHRRAASRRSRLTRRVFDSIVVMPTIAPPPSRTAASGAPAPFAPPSAIHPDRRRSGTAQRPGQPPRGPIFSTFPQPQVGAPQQRPNLPAVRPGHSTAAAGSAPAAGAAADRAFRSRRHLTPSQQRRLARVSAPGMIAPPAQQPGQVAQPRRQNDNSCRSSTTSALPSRDAMRKQDAARLVPLRMLKAAFMNKSVEKGRDLDDAEVRQVVSSLVKQRRDSIEQFTKGGRQDLVDKETAEITVLEAYLPPAARSGGARQGRRRRDRRDRRDVREGHGPRDEGRHVEARRTDRGRQGRQRARAPQARRLTRSPRSRARPASPAPPP